MAELPRRKHPRLKYYDYARTGAYFITFCTKNKRCVLSSVGRGALAPPQVVLTPYGEIVDELIQKIPLVYSGTFLEHYVIMPNHVHLLLRLDMDDGGAGRPALRCLLSWAVSNPSLPGKSGQQSGKPPFMTT
jgi:REP element-mobilizing transposase RayT